MYELLVGRPPFVGETAISLAYQHVREAPVPPSQHNPLIHPQIEAITLKALAKDKADRYQSAREMKADIVRVLAGQGVVAPLAGLPDETSPVTAEPAAQQTLVAAATGAAPQAAQPPASLEPQDPPPARRRGLALLVGALVLLLLAGGGYGIWRAFGPGQTGAALVAVPDLLGASRAEAESRLRDAGLKPRFMEVNGKDDKTVDTIVKQIPVSGSDVATDSVVTAEINVGVETAVIPTGLTGEDVDKAEKRLEEAGFTNVDTEPAANEPSDADKDDTLSVDPAEGTSLALDKKITLIYATGRDDAGPSRQRETSKSEPKPEPSESESEESTETEDTPDPPESDEPSATQSTPPEASETASPEAPASTPTKPKATKTPKKPRRENRGQQENGQQDIADVSP
jgi:serine/threonine-protein kinase